MTVTASLDDGLVDRLGQLQRDLTDALTYVTKKSEVATLVLDALTKISEIAPDFDADGRLGADTALDALNAEQLAEHLATSLQTVKDLVAALNGAPIAHA